MGRLKRLTKRLGPFVLVALGAAAWISEANYRTFDNYQEQANREITALTEAQEKYYEKHSSNENEFHVIVDPSKVTEIPAPLYFAIQIDSRTEEEELCKQFKHNPLLFPYTIAYTYIFNDIPDSVDLIAYVNLLKRMDNGGRAPQLSQ